MRIQDFLRDYPEFAIAEPGDQSRIQAFFDAAPMLTSGISIRYERRPDYFAFLKLQGDLSYVFLMRAADASIAGLGTLSFRAGLLAGSPERVGYLGDLRIQTRDRRLLRRWREFLAGLVTCGPRIEEFGGARYFQTAMLAENHRAENALARGRDAFVYDPVARYDMVTLLAALPCLGRSPPPGYFCRELGRDETSEYLRLYGEEQLSRPLGRRLDADELRRRSETWPNWRDSKLHGLFHDRHGLLLAGFLWNPSPLKKIRVEGLAPLSSLALRAIGMGAKGELPVDYFSFVATAKEFRDNSEHLVAIRPFFRHLWSNRRAAFLAFADFEGQGWARRLGTFLRSSTPLRLYTVRSKETPRIVVDGPLFPEFEMSLV